MDEELAPASTAGPAPLEQVKQTVNSDLEYVSLQMEGKTYGGWYRVLPDGQMELLALANVYCGRRPENSPVEQARGMLADLVRVARPQRKTNGSAAVGTNGGSDVRTNEDRLECTTGTLGSLLYANPAKTRVSEKDWVALVHSMAAGDQLALHELYERAHRVVFTLMLRLTKDRDSAAELTLDIFHDVWRRASRYDAAAGSVLGWIMNQARARALDRLSFEKRKDPANPNDATTDVPCPSKVLWGCLATRIAAETAGASATPQWIEPEWEEVAPGISCKLLATDTEKNSVSMLVSLAPGIEYPPHTHAGVEELHLLDGELLINDRKLYSGDYHRAEPDTADTRVWSETGCTCVLMTSTQDVLG